MNRLQAHNLLTKKMKALKFPHDRAEWSGQDYIEENRKSDKTDEQLAEEAFKLSLDQALMNIEQDLDRARKIIHQELDRLEQKQEQLIETIRVLGKL